MLVQAAPASAGHSVDPLYCLLCLQSKICLEGALNFAFSGSLTERSHDPDIFFSLADSFPGLNEIKITMYCRAHDKSEG